MRLAGFCRTGNNGIVVAKTARLHARVVPGNAFWTNVLSVGVFLTCTRFPYAVATIVANPVTGIQSFDIIVANTLRASGGDSGEKCGSNLSFHLQLYFRNNKS